MSGYIRQSTYIDGDVIQASDSNIEYDALVLAFNNELGHSHNGTAAEGPVISLIGDAGIVNPLNKISIDSVSNTINFAINVSGALAEQIKLIDGSLYPAVTNDVDLGTPSLKYKDGYFAGTLEIGVVSVGSIIGSPTISNVNIDSGTIDGTAIGSVTPSTGSFTSLEADTADIDGGTLDNSAIGSTTPSTAVFTSMDSTTVDIDGGTIDGTIIGGVVTAAGSFTSVTTDTADIDGGTIDGTTIGGTAAAAGNFTDVDVTGDITVAGTVDGRDVSTDGTKLDGIEVAADVTDTVNVEAAGALMDSELTNITAVKALDQGVSTTDTPTFAGVNTTTLDLTTIEVTNIKAKDGTASASIADSTGVMSISSAVISSADINSGTVDATLGGTTPAAATVTTLVATSGGSLTGTWTDLGSVTTVDINGGTVDNTVIGSTTPSTAVFTSMDAGTVDIDGGTVDGTVVGGVVPAEGYFTNLTASGTINIDLSNISTTGVLAVSSGGTGATNAEDARTNLDVDVAGTALALSIALG